MFPEAQLLAGVEYTHSAPEPDQGRQGRPTLIDNASLHNRRARLVDIFEGYWGEIGWTLRRIRKPDDLVGVFSVLQGLVWDDFVQVFWTISGQSGTAEVLARIRLELRRLGKPIRVASMASHHAYERLERARLALGHQAKRRDKKLVRKELVQRWKEEREASSEYKHLNEKEKSLRAQLKLAEADFTRREIFRFVKSKRYELNPLSLANAAAGLPFMAWRQSMRRCSKAKCISADGTHYQVFKAIRYLVLSVKKRTVQEFVEHFRSGVPQLPSRYRLARAEMAEKWFFMERALREVFRAKLHPKALPFEITTRYFRQMRVRTQTDMLLAERAKLML